MFTLNKKQMMLEQFDKIEKASNDELYIRMEDHLFHVCGKDIQILALGKDEILVEGTFVKMEFLYEN